MKRGFKSAAERIAKEMRDELDLTDDARLEPLELAECLAIPVFSLRQVSRVAPGNSFSRYFAAVDPDSFSAIPFFRAKSASSFTTRTTTRIVKPVIWHTRFRIHC